MATEIIRTNSTDPQIPGSVISKVTNQRTLNYTIGAMSMNFTVDPFNLTDVEDLLEILSVAKMDLEEMANGIRKYVSEKVNEEYKDETRSESTDSVQPVSEGEEA